MSKIVTVLVSVLQVAACGKLATETEGGCPSPAEGLAEQVIKGSTLDEMQIALSFDNAPTQQTQDVAELLSNKQIGGVFFVVGRQVKGFEGVLTSLHNSGHLIGNQTFSGKKLTAAPLANMEVIRNDGLISPYVVGDMFLLRAPFDAYNKDLATHLNRHGLKKYVGPVSADIVSDSGAAIDTTCWQEALTPGECATRYIEALAAKKKGIVRFTDGTSGLLGLLQELLPALASAGFKTVRLDQVPEIRRALAKRGAKVDTIGGAAGCDDYGG